MAGSTCVLRSRSSYIALILLGRLLESRAKSNTSTAIRKLIGLQPKTVLRLLDNGTDKEIPVKTVQEGDILIIKPGDKIPVDGILTEGVSFVDESMITGEPVPVEKITGSHVFAGTLNKKAIFSLWQKRLAAKQYWHKSSKWSAKLKAAKLRYKN